MSEEMLEAKENSGKAEAKKNKDAAYSKKMNKFFNPYTGLLHMPDGSKEFLDESKVGGVNNYHQHHNHL